MNVGSGQYECHVYTFQTQNVALLSASSYKSVICYQILQQASKFACFCMQKDSLVRLLMTDNNCIFQGNDTWVKANATSTIGFLNTFWLDLTDSDGKIPWVLNNYNEEIYNPNSASSSLNIFTTNSGIYPSPYNYKLVTVNSSYDYSILQIVINTTDGKITYIGILNFP